VVPKARGEAARILEESVAYRDQVIAAAEGEASRFTQVLAEYEKAPEVTRERLYIESLESVLSNSTKIMLDVDSGNNLMVLPLEQLLSGRVGEVIDSTPAELDRQKQAQTQVAPRSTRDTSRTRGAR
jgi:membrane protease subunit HflK